MKLMQDLVKKRKLYQILSLVIIILDLICFCSMETLDIAFTLPSEDNKQGQWLFIIKVKLN